MLVVSGEQRSCGCNQTIQGQRDKRRRLQGKMRLQGKGEARAAARSRLARSPLWMRVGTICAARLGGR